MAAVGLHPPNPGHQWLHDPLHHQAAVQDIPWLDDCVWLGTLHQPVLLHSLHWFKTAALLQILSKFKSSFWLFILKNLVCSAITASLPTSATGCWLLASYSTDISLSWGAPLCRPGPGEGCWAPWSSSGSWPPPSSWHLGPTTMRTTTTSIWVN